MAIEFIDITDAKKLLQKSSVKAELTEQSVKDSVITYALNVLRGIKIGKGKNSKVADIKRVLEQSTNDNKVWILTLRYGVVPVSTAKITATTKEEAIGDAIKYIDGLKTKMNENVAGQFRTAYLNKKKSLAKAQEKTKGKKGTK